MQTVLNKVCTPPSRTFPSLSSHKGGFTENVGLLAIIRIFLIDERCNSERLTQKIVPK